MLTGRFRTDAIKKAAHRGAWYEQDGDIKTYNPFGRIGAGNHRKPRDVEQGTNRSDTIHHVQTENDAVSPIENKRIASYKVDQNEFGGPPKSQTFGGGSSDPSGHLRTPGDTISSSEDSNESKSRGVEFKQEQDGMVDQSVGPTDTGNKPRKRKLRKFMPWKKDESQGGGDLDHTDTDDSKKKHVKNPNITVMSQFKVVFLSWINILLVAVPVGIAINYVGVNGIAVFVVNFIAIIPLAAMLSYATEELAMYIGEVLGGLLNATFGNAVELIVSIIALAQGKIIIVQTSLIGSMLSNLLLVMGMCFFFGGLRRVEQFFNVTVAQTAASLLALAVGSLIIPTAFKYFASNDSGVAPTSQGTAVLLLVTYACYLVFQLRTHVDIYNEPGAKAPKKPSSRRKSEGDAIKGMVNAGAGSAAASGGAANQQYLPQEEEGEEELPQLSKIGALVTLAGSTVLIALCAEFMVSAIGEVAKSVSPEFIGLILLPIVGNAAEHATAVTVAIKDKMDLAIGVAVGSSLQIALLVLPLMVIINWIGLGGDSPPMTLAFNGFQVVVLFIAVIVVNYLIGVCYLTAISCDNLLIVYRMARATGSRVYCCRLL